jgi:TolB-like protein/DNA-binding winged helix-turn-helix (wHTH) protein
MSESQYRFAEFQLDCASFELRRQRRAQKSERISLERIPMELLILLLERQGSVVTRQEIVGRLWGKDVFVDTEHGINTAIRKVRQALKDDPDNPRFIHTVSGKGYRFVPEKNGDATPVLPLLDVKPTDATQVLPAKRRLFWPLSVAAISLCLAAGALLEFHAGGLRWHTSAANPIGPIHSLAVLPLANLSGDPSQDYYADGMTDELITALAQNSTLRVVSRTSAMQYKGASQPLREIAQALGVDGILEGSVNRSANRVHINLQLIYAPTDTHVWAQSYDRDLNGTLSLPQEISHVIATEAKVHSAPPKTQHYVSPEAHDAYLQGRDYWFSSNYVRSKEYFEKAIRLQPDYALAWDGLGDSYGASAVEGRISAREAFEKEEQYARKALALDDSLPEAHNSMAAVYFFSAWDWHKAEAESLRAIELNPNYAEARHIHSYILSVLNRDEEAIREQKRSSELDPFARPVALANAYFWARHFDDAINELRVRAEIQPRDVAVQFVLFEAYWFKGRNKEAVQSLQQLFAAEDDKRSAAAVQRGLERGVEPVAGALFLKQDQDRARHHIYPIHFAFAYDYAMLHRKDEAIAALEADYREHDPWLVFLQKETAFDFLHSDERYRALVRKMGLPPAY